MTPPLNAIEGKDASTSSEVESTLKRLNSEVGKLDKLISNLIDRLSPVTAEEESASAKETVATPPTDNSCQLSKSIDNIAITVSGLGYRIETTTILLRI